MYPITGRLSPSIHFPFGRPINSRPNDRLKEAQYMLGAKCPTDLNQSSWMTVQSNRLVRPEPVSYCRRHFRPETLSGKGRVSGIHIAERLLYVAVVTVLNIPFIDSVFCWLCTFFVCEGVFSLSMSSKPEISSFFFSLLASCFHDFQLFGFSSCTWYIVCNNVW